MGKKLFDYVIGNPPYQESNETNGRQPPVYHEFMDAAYGVSKCVELITPARFLFNAGQTPKTWNEKMLQDEHFKVLHYEEEAVKVFPNTEIKGGVAIHMRNEDKDYGSIQIFTEYEEMNSILHKVLPFCTRTILDICIGAVPYHYSNMLKKDHPEWVELAGESFDIRTNAFDKLANKIFFEEKPSNEDYVQIFGLYNKKRRFMWVKCKYIEVPSNFSGYKIFVPKANGSGKFGEALSNTVIGMPNVGHTQSFISIGNFEKEETARNLEKYVKTKISRALLSVLRKTQDTTPYKWKYVPLQDFTENSDIDWSKSIHEIDLQLYRKYGLDEKEIEFIESHVKEMA